MDDKELLTAIAQGDDAALRELFQRHAPWIAGRLRRMLPAHAVEDVLQETFIAVWQSAGRYQAQGAVGAWIWGIARRQAAQWLRKRERTQPLPALRTTPDPGATRGMRLDLAQALQLLAADDESQELARLALVERRPLAEIAAHLDIPVGTVKSRLYHLRQRLRTYLKKGGY